MKQAIIDLYDEYTHKPLSRKEFLTRLAQLTGSMTLALSFLPMLEASPRQFVTVSEDELFTEYINYEGINGTMKAYVARPLEAKPYPAVIVIHENRGLTAHIEDVTRRAAQAGFLAVAPNALAPAGIVPKDEDEARTLFAELKPEDNLQNFLRVFDYLKTRSDSSGQIGCVGFCWGGAMAGLLAAKVETLKASVSFYGKQPALEDVPKIKAAVQLHYAELDQRINEGKDTYEQALTAAGVRFESHFYPGVNHAFHNNTSEARYDKDAAVLAWDRTVEFLRKYLSE